jgi:predicted HTH transcriptional regulator
MVTVSSGGAQKDNVTDNVTDNGKNRIAQIVSILSGERKISSEALARKFQVTKRTILRDLQTLKNANKIRRIGSGKTGYWEVRGNS